MSISFIGNLM